MEQVNELLLETQSEDMVIEFLLNNMNEIDRKYPIIFPMPVEVDPITFEMEYPMLPPPPPPHGGPMLPPHGGPMPPPHGEPMPPHHGGPRHGPSDHEMMLQPPFI